MKKILVILLLALVVHSEKIRMAITTLDKEKGGAAVEE